MQLGCSCLLLAVVEGPVQSVGVLEHFLHFLLSPGVKLQGSKQSELYSGGSGHTQCVAISDSGLFFRWREALDEGT